MAGGGTETDEQLCQVDFAPLGKGNLSVGEEEIKVAHTHKKKDKVRGVEGAAGGRWRLGGACNRTRVHPPTLLPPSLRRSTSPPSAYRPAQNANCQCEY